jgi:uncharacterized repeat protein (TIGR03806 family)
LIPYSINHPFWSDHALKTRYLAIPNGHQITFSPEGNWEFPVGSLFVKHFQLELEKGNPASSRHLETRLLFQSKESWQGYTYRWNEAQTEAFLVDKAQTQEFTVYDPQSQQKITQSWYFPSPQDCLRCHTPAAGFVLGVRTGQMNKEHLYPSSKISAKAPPKKAHQLKTLDAIGLFHPPLSTALEALPRYADLQETTAPLETRIASYLAANCSFCHQPLGSGNSLLDLRFETPLAQKGLFLKPSQGDLGVSGATILKPKTPEESVLWLRLQTLDLKYRMPPLASHQVDTLALEQLKHWIQTLD